MPANAKRLVACPTCRTLVEFSSENLYRPFCSKRCQMIDLGEWADEKHRIPDATPPDLDEQSFS
jgi:uncharacterized protein